MEGEVGAQVASPMFIHQSLVGRFHDPPVAKKRDSPWQNTSFHPNQQRAVLPGAPNSNANWNPGMWDWDWVRFSAKPSEAPSLGTNSPPMIGPDMEKKKKGVEGSQSAVVNVVDRVLEDDGENLTLKLGGGAYVEEPVVRPNKRVRSGSPGSARNYPMCQVDDCRADLSGAKDYHRRHKVCELHSKTTKALVGKQMQRFCQQCSRFHPLSEFDEGKRSCRRRLAGHNRRRRKTQPEDASSRLLLAGSQENGSKGGMDIVNLLAILAKLQGTSTDKVSNGPSLPDKEQLVQILSKLNSISHGNSAAKLHLPGGFDLNITQAYQQGSSEPPQNAASKLSAPSTVDFLAVLAAALAASAPGALASLSQGSSGASGNDKSSIQGAEPASVVTYHKNSAQVFSSATLVASGPDGFACLSQGSSDASANDKANIQCVGPSTDVFHGKSTQEIPPGAMGRRNHALQSTRELFEHPPREAQPSLEFQLFTSAEGDSPPKLGSPRKYLSSESSNPIEERSPSSSPPVAQKLFPICSESESMKCDMVTFGREENMAVEASTTHGWRVPLELFKESERRVGNDVFQSQTYQPGYTSSSVSDHSPSSSNSDVQDRTGRIIFKLFDKDPSTIPGTLRTQILSWLSHCPSEMESYIRPGCIVLSVYVSMPSVSWDELEDDLYQRVHLLLQGSDSDFWRNARFLVRTSRQLVSHKDGKIHLCKSWKTWSAPELISVTPVAVVSGQETSVILRGRNLTVPGTKIHCTYMGGYKSKAVLSSAHPGTIYDGSSVESFHFPGGSANAFGRCFIEVENGFKGNSFPLLIADAAICQELRTLESDIEDHSEMTDLIQRDQVEDYGQPRSREDVLHFLNELGWLFQRKSNPCGPFFLDFTVTRFKFLLIFSVERDCSALVKMLLDTLVERSSKSHALIQESLEMVSEIQLLSRAVKRKCRRMVELLVHFSVNGGVDASKVYIFLPSTAGHGGLTPLHLAACTQESEDIVDALTNDPQEIGLKCWDSIRDDNGQSPSLYASMRNNHSYNTLVARKLADRQNGQVSISIQNEESPLGKPRPASPVIKHGSRPLYLKSCAQCASIDAACIRPTTRSRGLLQRPYINSMLAIAAVCVCVCLFFRGSPDLGSVAPFKWENLDFGTS